MAPSGTVTRGKGKASSTAASHPASRSGSPPADDANTTIVPGTIPLAPFREPGDLPSQIPGFPSTSYLGQTASSSASIIEGISSSTPFEHADNPALSHEPTPAYRSYCHAVACHPTTHGPTRLPSDNRHDYRPTPFRPEPPHNHLREGTGPGSLTKDTFT